MHLHTGTFLSTEDTGDRIQELRPQAFACLLGERAQMIIKHYGCSLITIHTSCTAGEGSYILVCREGWGKPSQGLSRRLTLEAGCCNQDSISKPTTVCAPGVWSPQDQLVISRCVWWGKVWMGMKTGEKWSWAGGQGQVASGVYPYKWLNWI